MTNHDEDAWDDLLDSSISNMRGVGREAGLARGKEEGFALGRTEGEKRGSELGFYRGYTMTWIHLLQSPYTQPASKSAKILNKLTEIVNLVDSFPKTNDKSCDERLSAIRMKFKQSTSLLSVNNI